MRIPFHRIDTDVEGRDSRGNPVTLKKGMIVKVMSKMWVRDMGFPDYNEVNLTVVYSSRGFVLVERRYIEEF